MTIHSRYLRKYKYRIERSRILEVKRKYIYRLYDDSNQINVLKSDWEDFQFLLRVNSPFLITKVKAIESEFIVNYTPKRQGLKFRVTKEINSVNHPWIDGVIEVGTILSYCDESDHGVVNRYNGLAINYKGLTQVNYDYIEFIHE